ncbi:hypothetical protein BCR44DRAFT_60397 [Catenaria anguillulae PL171]|uniref:Uncharacterized protein n=1 Tax=Catenaria anguillulae PL171 TaxID=765915 RepID=A0A1Y2HLY6_9FUNG|nr:hypothetical protein BCR44DRAFT_60397 [Catenaria anguillulae PL171]
MYPGHHHPAPASVRRATLARPGTGHGPGMTGGPADENGFDDDDDSSHLNATAMALPMSAAKRMVATGTPVPGTPSLHRGLFKKPGHLTAATPSKPQLASATPRHASKTPASASVKPHPTTAKPTPAAPAPARRLLFPSGATVPGTPASGSRGPSFASTTNSAARHVQTPRGPTAKPTPVPATTTPARGMYAATPSAAATNVFKTPAPVVRKSARELAREVIASFHEPEPVYLGSEPVHHDDEIEYCPTGKHLNDAVDPNDALFFPLDHFEIAPIPTFDFLPSPHFRPSTSSSSSDDDDQAGPLSGRRPLSPVKTAAGVLPPPGPLLAVDIVDLDFDKTAESIEADTSSSCGSDFDFGDSLGDDGLFVGSVGLIHEHEHDESWASGAGGSSTARRNKKTLNQVLDEMEASRPCPLLLFESDED